ncbi:uncharacterized protein LOC135098499 isoform X2 [Scylla paramamosain]|uniref:uncharacterized protein LOC135098499 isoform X2 n=1 Tax=Scylla paramamosain TaxID=85552 RepID=UPI00308355F3
MEKGHHHHSSQMDASEEPFVIHTPLINKQKHLFHYHDAMHDRVKKILKERQKEAEDSLVAHLQVCLPSAVQHIHGLCDWQSSLQAWRVRVWEASPLHPRHPPHTPGPTHPWGEAGTHPKQLSCLKIKSKGIFEDLGFRQWYPCFSPNPTPRTPLHATPWTPWGRLSHPMHPTHPMNADSGCPELHHKTQAWTQLTSHSPLSPPTAFDSLPQCITASYSIGCQNTAHQSFPQWPETAHSKMVNQNEQTHELTHIDTAPNAIEPTHSIPQQPGGQHSITDSPDTLRTPQHTAQDEILSLAFASPVINSTGGDDSTQWHTAGTQGLVRTEQQATASPHPVDAVREAGRPHTRHKIEKRTERGTINSKDHFKNKTHNFCCYFCCYYCYYYCGYCYRGCICVLQQYLPVYRDLDKTSPLNKMKISEQGRRKITRRTRRTRGRRDTDTQTHTHTQNGSHYRL